MVLGKGKLRPSSYDSSFGPESIRKQSAGNYSPGGWRNTGCSSVGMWLWTELLVLPPCWLAAAA
eukprot:14940829-Heterocapsa_arctica.AAC.1